MSLQGIHFIDIETVPVVSDIEPLRDIDPEMFKAFCRRHNDDILAYQQHPIPTARQMIWMDRAGLQAEFGKIICVSVGFLTEKP